MRSSQLCSSSCAGPRLDSGRVRDDDEVVAVVVQHGQKMPNLLHVSLGIGRSCLKPGGGDLSHADT